MPIGVFLTLIGERLVFYLSFPISSCSSACFIQSSPVNILRGSFICKNFSKLRVFSLAVAWIFCLAYLEIRNYNSISESSFILLLSRAYRIQQKKYQHLLVHQRKIMYLSGKNYFGLKRCPQSFRLVWLMGWEHLQRRSL